MENEQDKQTCTNCRSKVRIRTSTTGIPARCSDRPCTDQTPFAEEGSPLPRDTPLPLRELPNPCAIASKRVSCSDAGSRLYAISYAWSRQALY